MIEAKLEAVRGKAKELGELRGTKEVADERLKIVYAILYDDVPSVYKTVPERDAWVKRQPKYEKAVTAKENAYARWTEAEAYMKCLFAEVDVWRSQEATGRMIDRAHT